MRPRTQKKGRLTKDGTPKDYPFYRCTNFYNKYASCPTHTTIRTSPLDEIVWRECCLLFKRIDDVQAALKKEVEAAVKVLLEDTTGQNQIKEIIATIELAKKEREKHEKGTYLYNLLSEDIVKKEADLARYQQELSTSNVEAAVSAYQQKVADFFQFQR